MDYLELFKEFYYKEIDRKTGVQNALNIPITFLTVLSSAILFFLTTYDFTVDGAIKILFIVLSCLVALCILVSIWFIIKGFNNFTKGYTYSWVPFPTELLGWYKDLKDYYIKNDATSVDADDYFKDYLIKNLAKHANHNLLINDTRFRYILISKKFLIIGLILILLTMIPYGYNYYNKSDTINKVEIINHIK